MNNYKDGNEILEEDYNTGPTFEEWEEQNNFEDILYDEWRDDNE